jgi:hypothetical protein
VSFNRTQKIILGAGACALAALVLYVPWVFVYEGPLRNDSSHHSRIEQPGRYGFVFSPPAKEEKFVVPGQYFVAHVDWSRALLPIGAVVGVTVVALLLARKPRSP